MSSKKSTDSKINSKDSKKSSDSKTASNDTKKSTDSKLNSKDSKTASNDSKKSTDSKTSSKDVKKSTDSNAKPEPKNTGLRTKSSSVDKSESKTASTDSGESIDSKSSKLSKGMESSLRMTSTDIRTITKESQTANMSAGGLIPAGGAPPGESVYDAIAYVIRCPKHQKVAIFKADKDKITWLPFIASGPNRTWKDSSVDGISIIFNKQDQELDAKLGTKVPIKEKRILHIFRTQIPNTQRFISLVIYYVVLDEDKSNKFKCCRNEKRIKWLPIQDVKSGNIENVWGPEAQDFTQDNILDSKNAKTTGFTEQTFDQIKELLPRAEGGNPEQLMVKEAGIGEPELEKLFDDYIEHCFPSLTMSFDSFKTYMHKYLPDLDDNRFPLMYNAFNSKKNNCLNFYELVTGLAAMETKATNSEPRLMFIFRYYNTDCSGNLTQADYKKFVKVESVGSTDAVIDGKVKDTFAKLGATNAITFDVFKKGVEGKIIRGLSNHCKASILGQITKSTTTRMEKKTAIKKKAGFLMQNRRNKGKCLACRGKKYEYGLHAIKLDTNGRCVEPRRIFEPDATADKMNPQKYSMDYTFNTRSMAHTIKDLIRDYNRKKDSKGFLSQDRETLISYLQVLGRDVEDFFSGEDRLIKVNSPAYVFGDILGNIDDLLHFDKILYQSFPILSGHYIFLGNYIGHGKYGVECAIYLLALKLISPLKIILLRGNHECREMQKKIKFDAECIEKYGSKHGQKICEILNTIFDKIPLCAIVDENIFCSHSGVPSTTKASDISNIGKDLNTPGKNQLAWEIMDSRPKEVEVTKFLKSLQLSHFIHSNSVSETGYKIDVKEKVVTIHSSSSPKNQAVAAFIDSDRIRIIRLDSPKNQMKKEAKTEPKTETLKTG